MASCVTVSIDVQEKFGGSTMYNMSINSKLGTTKIAGKTYTDYETLHTSLSRKYQGQVPPIPPKKGPGDKGQRHANIKSGLHTFLNGVLSRAETAGDADLCRFICLDAATTTAGLVGAPQAATAPPPAPATPLPPAAPAGEGPSPGIPPGLEGYLKTDAVTPGSAGAASPHAAPAAPIITNDPAFSPTPLPAAITPASTPGVASPPAPAPPVADANPLPSPPAQADPTPAIPPPRAAANAAPPRQAARVPSSGGDRVLQPGAYEAPYTGSDEDIVRAWIKDLTGTDLSGEASLQEALKSGVVLCGVVNRVIPGRIKKVQNSTMPFPQRENIAAFNEAVRELGVRDRDNFTTEDLFENRNMKQVCLCVMALSRACYFVDGYQGPCIGKPEMAAKRESKFGEIKTEGLWGKANGAHTAADGRPTGGVPDKNKFSSPMRP